MKKVIYLLFVLAVFACSETKRPQRDAEGKILKNGQFYDSQEAETKEVWVCFGKKSHAYHSNKECYGIQACKGKVRRMSLGEAVYMGRTPCHYCHKDVAEGNDEDCEDCEEADYDPDKYDTYEEYLKAKEE